MPEIRASRNKVCPHQNLHSPVSGLRRLSTVFAFPVRRRRVLNNARTDTVLQEHAEVFGACLVLKTMSWWMASLRTAMPFSRQNDSKPAKEMEADLSREQATTI